jgi:hypothetical protein
MSQSLQNISRFINGFFSEGFKLPFLDSRMIRVYTDNLLLNFSLRGFFSLSPEGINRLANFV